MTPYAWIELMLFFTCCVSATTGSSGWQLCNDKCYFLNSKVNNSYIGQADYCKTMGRGKPVNFGSKLEASLASELKTCRLSKLDNEPYWINKANIGNRIGTPSCRTVTFSGNNIHMKHDVSCSSTSHPFCEADKSFCQSSGNRQTITHDWVNVDGQSSLYKLSSATFPYCKAKDYCDRTLHAKIAHVGNNTFLGILATEIGLTGEKTLDFWLDSPGISCQFQQGVGTIGRYAGPFVNITESTNAGVDLKVLCESPNTTNPTTSTLSQTDMTSSNTHKPTAPTTLQTNIISSETQSVVHSTKKVLSSTTALSSRQPVTISSTKSAVETAPGPEWITISQEEYFVHYKSMSYRKADTFCRDQMNASLVMFLNPIRYFTILAQIDLRNNSFWVGVHVLDKELLTGECLSYIVNSMTMTLSPCQYEKFSICSRLVSGDISRFLEDPEFKKMIREMTVLKNETGKRIRKQTSASDRRPSARAAGGVGVFIICSVITVILMSDCSGVKRTFFTRKKNKNNQS